MRFASWAVRWMLALACALSLSGCGGGGGGSSSGGGTTTSVQNTLPMVVDAGPASTVNVPFVSVTICTPGTSQCQTIDHIIVDTGSSGLRIMASVLSPSLSLTQQTSGGKPLVECMQFADGYSWGPVKDADVELDGETLKSVAVQVIGDPSFTSVPGACSGSGPAENTVRAFGGNGLLGVSEFRQDCGQLCAQSAIPGTYYTCSGTACQAVAVGISQQLQNPVTLLGNDNNGVVLDLPSVAATGAASVSGSLIFGIGTETNNALGNAVVFALDPTSGTLTTTFGGTSYSGSFVDSGSNGLFFPDSAIPTCSSGFFCPSSTQQFTATNLGVNGSSGTVNFSIANADSLMASGNTAFNNLGASSFPFDWGLPFFFGRKVYTAIEGATTPGGTGPYVAY